MKDARTGETKIWGRPAIPQTKEYVQESLVDGLFRRRRIHLFAGPSTAGKSRMAIQVLEAISRGESIFGHQSHKADFVYYVADRDHDDVAATLFDMGVSEEVYTKYWYPRVVDPAQSPGSGKDLRVHLRNYIVKQNPEARVILVDGMSALLGNKTDFDTTIGFLRGLRPTLVEFDLTIIGLVHTAKVKEGEGYELTRENILGSVAWGAASDTVLLFHAADRKLMFKDPGRRIEVSNRSARGEELFMTIHDDDGRFYPDEIKENGADEPMRKQLYKEFVAGHKKFITAELIEFFEAHKNSKGSAERILRQKVTSGELIRLDHGQYELRPRDPFQLTDPDDDLPDPRLRN